VIARFRRFLDELGEAFWLLPAAMVLAGIAGGGILLGVDRSGIVPPEARESFWLYNGTATGARTLLGAIISSTIGVAGTVFSITIAALSLAAGQMGPRLLRNFTRDRGNQFTLGLFLGTFCYALVVLRSVRAVDEGGFTPHVALSAGMVLAFACVATLVYFVGHMASRINVDTVIDLVSADMRSAVQSLITDQAQAAPPPETFWREAVAVVDARQGYLQQLHEPGLAAWAAEQGTAIRLLVRRGDFVFPGTPIALLTRAVPEAEAAIRDATALGAARGGPGDAEHAARQLVEVAVRALSPGINDPHTAMSVLDRLGAALCDLAGHRIPSGVTEHEGKVALVVPSVSYESLCAVMFHMIRQHAAGGTSVMIKMVDVLTAVLACESDLARRAVLRQHVDLVWTDAQRTILNGSDLGEIGARVEAFGRVAAQGPTGLLTFGDEAI
jgi:uncharacterized membrane protein